MWYCYKSGRQPPIWYYVVYIYGQSLISKASWMSSISVHLPTHLKWLGIHVCTVLQTSKNTLEFKSTDFLHLLVETLYLTNRVIPPYTGVLSWNYLIHSPLFGELARIMLLFIGKPLLGHQIFSPCTVNMFVLDSSIFRNASKPSPS